MSAQYKDLVGEVDTSKNPNANKMAWKSNFIPPMIVDVNNNKKRNHWRTDSNLTDV